jgi:hypothetical protein
VAGLLGAFKEASRFDVFTSPRPHIRISRGFAMIVKALRPVVVPPGLVVETGRAAVCPDPVAYDLAACGAVLTSLRARVLRDGTMVGNAICNAGDVVDLPVFADVASFGSRVQADCAARLAAFDPTIGVVAPGEAGPVEVPVMAAMAMVKDGRARYAEPATVVEAP